MKIKKLLGKFKRTWKEEGGRVALKKTVGFLGDVEVHRQRKRDAALVRSSMGQVLFINGCCVPHPTRYRVHHQMEMLESVGVSCRMVFFDDLEPGMESNYEAFFFFRCECTEEVAGLIQLAKAHGKTVYFDIDDLITDTVYSGYVPFVRNLTPRNRQLFERSMMRMGQTLACCDIAVTTTEALAEELGKVAPYTYISRNVASEEMVSWAEKAYREAAGNVPESRNGGRIWLGYFSGSLTHNQDFEMIRPALIKLMEAYPQVGLILVGELDASDELKSFADRIVKERTADWRTLPKLIIQADINLAPLEDTIFTRAKSEIKWIEAALVRVPTVASCVGAFEKMIEHGITGVLCDNTTDSWYQGMCMLIEDEDKRRTMGEDAYQYVMTHCTTRAQAKQFGDFIKSTCACSSAGMNKRENNQLDWG